MIQDKTKLYPIGTVVELEGVDVPYMISGYFRILANGQVMDYSGVVFPDGDTGPGSYLLFNQDNIKKAIKTGLSDADYELFAEHIGEVEQEVHERVQQAIDQAVAQKKKAEFSGLD